MIRSYKDAIMHDVYSGPGWQTFKEKRYNKTQNAKARDPCKR